MFVFRWNVFLRVPPVLHGDQPLELPWAVHIADASIGVHA